MAKIKGCGGGFWVLWGFVVIMRKVCCLIREKKLKSVVGSVNVGTISKIVKVSTSLLKSGRKSRNLDL